LITIILTTLNSEKYVSKSVQSCLDQSLSDLELLIVDGGSTDRTLEIIAGFQDPRIRVINQAGNTGKLPGAINLGLANARGEYITWTQDDCWYELDAMETMLNFLIDHPDVSLVYADYLEVDDAGAPIKYQAVHPPEDILIDDVIRVCFLMRRQVYNAIGPQEPKYHPVHEVPWRVKVVKRFKISPLHRQLMVYIVRDGSLTGQFGNRQLRWMTSKILLDEGIIDQKVYKECLSQAEMDQAFIEFIDHGNYGGFWKYAISGIRLNPRWLMNRGLLKFMLISIMPTRDKFREVQEARTRKLPLGGGIGNNQ
jgi:glycosyltransferase involved in cell wall biosynthesis